VFKALTGRDMSPESLARLRVMFDDPGDHADTPPSIGDA